jgi:hypothetical protein
VIAASITAVLGPCGALGFSVGLGFCCGFGCFGAHLAPSATTTRAGAIFERGRWQAGFRQNWGDARGAGVGRKGIAAGGMIVGRKTGVATLRGASGPGLGATLRGAAASDLFVGAARPVTSSASKWRVATWLLPRGARGESGDGCRRACRMS